MQAVDVALEPHLRTCGGILVVLDHPPLMCQRMVLQRQSEHHRACRQIHWQEHFESWYECVRILGGVAKVSSEVPRPSHVANSDLLHCSRAPHSMQQITLTGAACYACPVLPVGVAHAWQANLGAYHRIRPSGTISRLTQHACWLLAGALVSMETRKFRSCAPRHAVTR